MGLKVHSGLGFQLFDMQFGKALAEVKKLATGYYIGGIILSVAFFVLKITSGLCTFVFGMEDECGLDRREHEIMVFLAIMVCYKNRKAANWMHCLANMFLFCKLANIFLFLRADLIAGVFYICACLIHSVFYPEPICAESEGTIIYNNTELYDEIQRNAKMTWLIYFYTSWSPECKHISHVFAELSDRFHLPNLRFAKLDVGKWSQEANRFRINIHPTSRQLPTISLFKEGKEAQRRPAVHNRRALPFVFTKENCILAFDLINLYEKCKSNMTKHEKEQFINEQSKKEW
uniref:Thioredoxin domain-containing protein n=1 Tax=Elaeophora elaphi TaxID=1147741 RepID=A0A0R3RSM9_9BILA